MGTLNLNKLSSNFALILFLGFLVCANSYAASTTGSLPFNTSMETFKSNFIAFVFAATVVLWVAMCLMLAFGEWTQGIKQIINVIFWISLALAGATGITLLFGNGAII